MRPFLEAETALLASGRYPCRNIDQNMADLEGAGRRQRNRPPASCESGSRTFGLDVVQAYMGHVQDNAEESVRRVIGRSRGRFTYPMDHGAVIEVAVRVDRETARGDDRLHRHLCPQQNGNYNAPKFHQPAVVLYVFRTLVGRDIPLNEGCLKPLRHPARRLHAQPRIPRGGDRRQHRGQPGHHRNALYGALGVIAGSQATMNNFVWGNERVPELRDHRRRHRRGPGLRRRAACRCT
jgi:5-oxoprolinase (ATP-hydrolysing)